jgi:hypothetical protein
MAKRRAIQFSLDQTAHTLERRFADVEALAKDHGRVLDVQFKRMATMQAELDFLKAALKRLL